MSRLNKKFLTHVKYFFVNGQDVSLLSRKTKKAIVGKKMNRSKLKKRLAAVVVTENRYPSPATISDEFCPRCGCEGTRSTGNMAPYPEVWVQVFCIRCGFIVGTADNSPWVHALEVAEDNYELN